MSHTDAAVETNRWIARTIAAHLTSTRTTRTTKRALSDATGIPYATLNRKMNGQADWTFRELLAVADAVGAPARMLTPPLFRTR